MACMEVWGGSDAADAAVSLPGLDAFVYSRPFEDAGAGGDVYYVSACAHGQIDRLLLADVCGHGRSVESVAIQLRDLMRRYVNYCDQSRFVLKMNRRFVECSAAGCFATAAVMTFYAPTRELSVCNAGHPPPLVWRAARGEWTTLHATCEGEADEPGRGGGNLPLGIVEYDDCEQFRAGLDVGDLVVVYTDSLIEAADAARVPLGVDGLLRLARERTDPTRPHTVIPALLRAIEEQTGQGGGGLNADDVTVLLLRANGTGTSPPILASLLAPFRLLGSIGGALLGRGPVSWPDVSLATFRASLAAPFARFRRRVTP
jgi:sigma-B regulation protein RsbU (phosphoserine phosphatase)